MNPEAKYRYLLFLSHAGSDTESALALAEQIELSSKDKGLKVWVDKKDLKPGSSWQSQLEHVLETESTAFAVYVGSRGVINWVESEVQVALSRAKQDTNYPFIPILSKSCEGSDSLPAFVRQYQGVFDVENNTDELKKLIRVITRQENKVQIQLVDEPFLGLKAFSEKDVHLFFGRERATDDLVEQLKRSRLIVVVGDSGSGKSSLVKAGLTPRFRGGALNTRPDPRSEEIIWHVLETRPRSNPFDGLADSVASSAKSLGRNQQDIRSIRRMIRDQQPQEIADAITDSAPQNAKILLVMDQFEELFTLSNSNLRGPFINALLHLVKHDSLSEFRVVLTMRRDYYNLCAEYPELYSWFENKNQDNKFFLCRMSNEELRSCIEKPLALTNATNTGVFVDSVLRDVGDQPGDLALLEMALTESWRRRHNYNGDLLRAYTSIGGTVGALGTVADEVYETLNEEQRDLARAGFMRLVRLGDTGGTTRRVATRDEFTDKGWEVLQKLATGEYGRLIHISGVTSNAVGQNKVVDESEQTNQFNLDLNSNTRAERFKETAELSHEALVAQWPRYQGWLQDSPKLKRIHDALIPTAKGWVQATKNKTQHLLRGYQLDDALEFSKKHPLWLSKDEQKYISSSRKQDSLRKLLERGAVIMLVLLTVVAIWFAHNANVARQQADLAKQQAEQNAELSLARQLAAQAQQIPNKSLSAVIQAALLTAESLRRAETLSGYFAYSTAVNRLPSAILDHKSSVDNIHFSATGNQIATTTENYIRIWDVKSGKELQQIPKNENYRTLQFSPDGNLIAVLIGYRASDNKMIRLWDIKSGLELQQFAQGRNLQAFQFNSNGTRIATMSGIDVQLWDVETGKELQSFTHEHSVTTFQFNASWTQLATTLRGDNKIWLWDVKSGMELHQLAYEGRLYDAKFNSGDSYAFRGTNDRLVAVTRKEEIMVRTWDVESGEEIKTQSLDNYLRGFRGLEAVQLSLEAVQLSVDGARVAIMDPCYTNQNGNMIWIGEVGFSGMTRQRFVFDDCVKAYQLSADGSRITTLSESNVTLWDVESGEELKRLTRHKYHSVVSNDTGTQIAAVPTAYKMGKVKIPIWNLESGEELKRFAHGNFFNTLEFSPDGNRLAVSTSDNTFVWDVNAGDKLYSFPHDNDVGVFQFNPNGTRLATARGDSGVDLFDKANLDIANIWDLESGEKLQRLVHDDTIFTLQFSPDGTRVATGSKDRTVRVWNVITGEELRQFTHDGSVMTVQFNPEGTHIATLSQVWGWEFLNPNTENEQLKLRTQNNKARIWDVESGEELRQIVLDDNVDNIQLNIFGTRLATVGMDGKVRIWNVESNDNIQLLADKISKILFSPNGTQLATVSEDNIVQIWDVTDGKELHQITFDDYVYTFQFSPDSTRLATASGKMVQIWGVTNGQELLRFTFDNNVNIVKFSPDSTRLATATNYKTARIWRLDKKELIDELCGRLSRNLSCEEWSRYLGNSIYRPTCPNLPGPPECP